MKKVILLKNQFFVFLMAMSIIATSCSSDNTEDTVQSPSIIGKWHNYKRVENGISYTDISDLNYEFQTNACLITENGETNNYFYKVEGDYIKFYNPKTEVVTGSERIITLTNDELVVVNQYNSDELKYFKRL